MNSTTALRNLFIDYPTFKEEFPCMTLLTGLQHEMTLTSIHSTCELFKVVQTYMSTKLALENLCHN